VSDLPGFLIGVAWAARFPAAILAGTWAWWRWATRPRPYCTPRRRDEVGL